MAREGFLSDSRRGQGVIVNWQGSGCRQNLETGCMSFLAMDNDSMTNDS